MKIIINKIIRLYHLLNIFIVYVQKRGIGTYHKLLGFFTAPFSIILSIDSLLPLFNNDYNRSYEADSDGLPDLSVPLSDFADSLASLDFLAACLALQTASGPAS